MLHLNRTQLILIIVQVKCKVYESDLVSIESNEEGNFLKDTVNKFPQSGTEYYIGLTKDKDWRWRWISNNSTVNETYWAPYEPKNRNDERCAIMYKDYNKNYGLFTFDALRCTALKGMGIYVKVSFHVLNIY